MAEPQLQRRFPDTGLPRHSGTPSGPAIVPDTAVPAQYELLLAKLELAEHELVTNAGTGRSSHLEEASGIVFDLLYSLDFKNGGELVPRLAALYGYIGNELLNVGRTGDRVQLGHLRDMIETLKQSW